MGIKNKKSNFGIIILIFTLCICLFTWYQTKHISKAKEDNIKYQIWHPVNVRENVKVIGSQREYVLSASDSNLRFSGHFAYTLDQKVMKEKNGKVLEKENEIPKSDYFKIHLYDLNKEELPLEVIDLNKIVKKYKSGYFPIGFGISEFRNTPKNILAIKVKNLKGKIEVWSFNIDTGKMEGGFSKRSDTYQDINTIFTYTSLDKYADEKGYLVQHNINNYSGVSHKKIDTNINLFVEYPEAEDKIIHHDWTLFPRNQYVTPEEWFNKVLYWLAPKGEDKLTIYGIDRKGQVSDVPLSTYDQYQDWVKKQESENNKDQGN